MRKINEQLGRMIGEELARGEQRRGETEEKLLEFSTYLKKLKVTGCNLLVVGDAPKRAFTRASANLLGEETLRRYRLLAITDATQQSVLDRLPSPTENPCLLPETTRILNFTSPSRSLTSADSVDVPAEFSGVPERRVDNLGLTGFEKALFDEIGAFENLTKSREIHAGKLRIGVDSLDPLFERHEESTVQRFLRTVGERVVDADAMAHYILRSDYESDIVESVVDEVNAVIEVRTPDEQEHRHKIQQRWHVPARNLTMDWIPI